VDDLVDGLIRLMESPVEVTGPLNLGNPAELTIRRLAELIIEVTSSASTLQFLPLPTDDPKQRQPDITRATSLLGWTPMAPLEAGLRATVEFFRDRTD
jgi:UDP-glucuronate decarboxylase